MFWISYLCYFFSHLNNKSRFWPLCHAIYLYYIREGGNGVPFEETVLPPSIIKLQNQFQPKRYFEKNVGNTIITINHKSTEINRIA